jgi:hypothetical protein
MGEPDEVDHIHMVDEIDRVLKFSRAYFEAFEVETDRIRYWKFLILVLRKELAGTIRDNFSESELKDVLGETSSPPQHWKRELVRRFANSSGRFLEPIGKERAPSNVAGHQRKGRPPTVKLYRLSKHYDAAAVVYVREALKEALKIRLPEAKVMEDHGPTLFKQIMLFLVDRYWPPWVLFVKQAAQTIGASKLLEPEFTKHAPYWAITLVVWKKYLDDPRKMNNAEDLFTDVRHTLRRLEVTELGTCLNFAVGEEFLTKQEDEGSGSVHYCLNPLCIDALRQYTITIAAARKELTELVRTVVN